MSMIYRLHYGRFGHVSALELTETLIEHAHSTSNLSLWLAGQPFEIAIAGRLVPSDDRQATVIAPFVPHSVKLASGGPVKTLSFYLDRAWLAAELVRRRLASHFNTIDLALDDQSHGLASEIAEDLLSQANRAVDDRLEMLLGRLLDGAVSQDTGGCGMPLDFRVAKAIRLMEGDLAREHSLARIAKEAGISRPQFFSLFRQHMELTPGTFWDALRIEHAISNMGSQDLNLTSIAGDLGFDAQGNFSRFFRQHIGVPPRQYRRALRKAREVKPPTTLETTA